MVHQVTAFRSTQELVAGVLEAVIGAFTLSYLLMSYYRVQLINQGIP